MKSSVHGRLYVFLARLLVNPNHLRRFGRVEGTNFIGGLEALASDHQVILVAEQAAHFIDGSAHLAHVLFFGEIDERLIFKRALVKADLQAGWGFHGCHKRSSLGDRGIAKEYFTPAGLALRSQAEEDQRPGSLCGSSWVDGHVY